MLCHFRYNLGSSTDPSRTAGILARDRELGFRLDYKADAEQQKKKKKRGNMLRCRPPCAV